MKDVAVPYALDGSGRLADPATVDRGEPCCCLQCGEPVTLNRGKLKIPYFSHQKGSQCSGMSVVHLAAQHRLRSFFEGHQGQSVTLSWFMPCPGTVRRYLKPTRIQRVHTKCPQASMVFSEVQVPVFDEVALEHHQGYVADVALLRGGEVVFWLEVYYTHRVPDEKARNLTVAWVEVDAEAVMKDPSRLQVLGSHHGQAYCPSCQQQHEKNQTIERQYARDFERLERQMQQDKLRKQEKMRDERLWMQQEEARSQEQERIRQEKLQKSWPFIQKYFKENHIDPTQFQEMRFHATRCHGCERPVVFFYTLFYIPQGPRLHHLLVQPSCGPPVFGGRLVQQLNRCPHCGHLHGWSIIEASKETDRPPIEFTGREFLRWLNDHNLSRKSIGKDPG